MCIRDRYISDLQNCEMLKNDKWKEIWRANSYEKMLHAETIYQMKTLQIENDIKFANRKQK